LASKEGFIRQVPGWREFVRHVHQSTDGFRNHFPKADVPGHAGYNKWVRPKWKASMHVPDLDGGAAPSFLGAMNPLPAAFWGTASGFHCLDQGIGQVWEHGYSHHMTRLMILANIATLLDVSPRELTDWFWMAYIDAFDWVVEPNVLAMGTFGTGPFMTTKPYISGAAYIHRMSDFCTGCAFNPKTNCPITNLYWAFLDRHKKQLQSNPRLMLPLRNLQKRRQATIRKDRQIFTMVRRELKKIHKFNSCASAPCRMNFIMLTESRFLEKL
jgi:deoxyribodipyrimidine photolyase-related protein